MVFVAVVVVVVVVVAVVVIVFARLLLFGGEGFWKRVDTISTNNSTNTPDGCYDGRGRTRFN